MYPSSPTFLLPKLIIIEMFVSGNCAEISFLSVVPNGDAWHSFD